MRLGMGLGLGNLLSGQPLTGFPNDFSFNFDGSNDYLELNSTLESVFQGAFTISAWIKPDDGNPSGINALFGSDSTSDQDRFRVMVKTDGKIGLLYRSNAGTAIDADSTSAVFSDGATDWTHIAVTLSQSGGTVTGTIYINGSSIAGSFSSSQTMSNFATTTNFAIGGANRAGSLTQYFDGLIDEVAVWNAELSASDVAKIASKPVDFSKASTYATDRTSNLKLWLRAGDKALPESDTAIARQDFYTDFDGTDDFIQTSNNVGVTGASARTFGLWFKPDATNQYYELMEWGGTGTANGTCGFYLYLSKIFFYGWGAGDFDTGVAPLSTWQHLYATYDGTTVKVYLNGALIGSSSESLNTADTVLKIGNSQGNEFAGSISSVSIYKTALDAQTIKQFAKSRFTPMRDNRFSVVSLDGTNDFIDCGNDSSLQFSGSFSIGCWFRTTDATATNEILISKSDDGVSAGWLIRLNSSRKLDFTYTNSASGGVGVTIQDTGNAVNDGQWHHVMFVHESGVGNRAYKDGALVDDNTIGTDLGSHTPNFHIGNQDFSTARALACDVSSASAYNVAKSTEEVYAIYQQGITYDESSLSGLVGYWRMGDDTSKAYPTIADSSSNSNDGTITNGASDDIVQQMVAGYDLGAFEGSEELASELVVDMDTWSMDAGTATINTSTNSVIMNQEEGSTNISFTNYFNGAGLLDSNLANGFYKLSFNVLWDNTPTSRKINIYEDGTNNVSTDMVLGENVRYFKITGSNVNHSLAIYSPSNNDAIVISNLSLKEVLQSEVSDAYPAIIDVNEPVLGVELSPDSDFTLSGTQGASTAGTYWTTGTNTTIADGKVTKTGGGSATLSSTNEIVTQGKLYQATIVIDEIDENTVNVIFSGTGSSKRVGGVGTHKVNGRANDTNERVYIGLDYHLDCVISFFSIKEIQGNVGTMTNQDSADLVYSSVLPDQSFLTGVNSAYNFIDLDGVDEYIDCGDINDMDGASKITIAGWAKRLESNDRITFEKSTGTNDRVGLNLDTDGVLYANVGTGSGGAWAYASLSGTDWNHIAMVYDGTQADNATRLNIYINGVKQSSSYGNTIPATTASSAGTFKIGRAINNSNYSSTGSVGSVNIFNKALSEIEVNAIYNLGRHGNLLDSYSDNLLGYWAMSSLDAKTGLSDVGDGTIYDRSGNSNHGTATNTESADLKSSPNAEPNGYAKGDTNRSTTTP